MSIGVPAAIIAPSTSTVSSGVATATTADCPAGSLIVGFSAGAFNQTVSSVTDSAGNSYAINEASTSGFGVSMFSCANCLHLPSGGTITVTMSGGGSFVLAVYKVSGAGAFDVGNTGTGSGVSTISVATGALSQSSEIIFAGLSASGGFDPYTEGTGFTPLFNDGAVNNVHFAYQIVSSSASVTYHPSWTGSTVVRVVVGGFKGAAVASPVIPTSTDQMRAAPVAAYVLASDWARGGLPAGFTPPAHAEPTLLPPPIQRRADHQFNLPPQGFNPAATTATDYQSATPARRQGTESRLLLSPVVAAPPVLVATDAPPSQSPRRIDAWVNAPPGGFTPPVRQTEWPNPAPIARRLDWFSGRPPAGFTPPPQRDAIATPAPIPRRQDHQLGQPPAGFTPPVRQSDWPTPQATQRRTDWAGNRPPATTSGPAQVPDWPTLPAQLRRIDWTIGQFQAPTLGRPASGRDDQPRSETPRRQDWTFWITGQSATAPAGQMDWPNPPRARDGFRHEAGYFIHIPTRPGAWFGALSRISDAPVQGAEFINPGSVIEFEPIRMTLSSLSREKGDPVVTQGWLNPGPETDVAVVTNAKPSLAKLSAATQTEIAAMTDDPVIAVAKYP